MASWMQEVMEYLPVGIRFHPTEEELLDHYLRYKTLGHDDPGCTIPDVNLCRWEPEELRAAVIQQSIVQSRNLEWWFFSEQKPGPTQNRSTRGGYWKKTGQTRDIKSRNGTRQVIGSKKILTFFLGNSSNSTKTHWVMHEYLLAGNALDDHSSGDRKNYVVCKIRCNSDEKATSAPSCEGEQDELMTGVITDLLEEEPDDGSIPEDKVQEKVQSLKTACMNNNANPNQHPMLRPDLTCNSSLSCTEWSFGRDSFGCNSQAHAYGDSDSVMDIPNYILELLSPSAGDYELQAGSYNGIMYELQGDNSLDPVHILPAAKVESLHAFGPFNEKKGIIEDDSTQSTASSLGTKTPKARREKELPQIISYAPSEAKGQRHTPSKIKEEIVSAGSSSTSTCNPREVATDGIIYETSAPRRQQTFTMDNKQTPKVKSLHGAGKLAKKKGIIKDNSTQSTASSLQNETSKSRSKKKLPQIISDVPSEAKALRDTPIKIKEEIIGTSSSSTSTHKPREEAMATQSRRHRIAANTARKEDTDLMEAFARELKLMLAKARSCSRHCSGRCSCWDWSVADYLLLLVVVALIAIWAIYLVCKCFISNLFSMRSQD